MKLITFVYVCAFFLGIMLLPTNGGNENTMTILVCAALIGLVGLPHGAIDHILFLKTTSKSATRFYATYLTLILCYIAVWVWYPLLAMLIFLFVSAYHFGESQFSSLKSHTVFAKGLFVVWGSHLLITYITYQQTALQLLCKVFPDMQEFSVLFSAVGSGYVPIVISGILLLLSFTYLYHQEHLKGSSILQEIYILSLIHISFYLFGPLLSFTLYFVILHSLKVLQDEYDFLQEKLAVFSLNKFVKLLTPFSLVSFAGLGLLAVLNQIYLDLSVVYLVILSISVVTLPHALVMHLFYNHNNN